MNISRPFIDRPIATTLLAVALFLVGVLGYQALPVASLPSVAFPTLLVTTKLPGASPATMSELITAPLERQLGEISGLSAMSSVSSLGTSAITLRFKLAESLDSAAQGVQAAINAAAATLPPNLPYPPVYTKVNPADAPILTLAMTSHTAPLYALANTTDTLLQPRLSEIPGVGQVTVEGDMKKAVQIHINPTRLAAYGLSLEDVRTALSNANQNGPKGGLEGRAQTFSLGATDQLTKARSFRRVVIASVNGAPVTLADVGSVHPGLQNRIVSATYNGTPAVLLNVKREPDANIIQTVTRVEAALKSLQKSLPPNVHVHIVANRTATIRASIADVELTLATSVILVILVIFAFLPSARAALIPAVALPLSLIGTFAVMHAFDFSLDNLSLMALTVASGFVVDDAIVMIENVTRFIENGLAPREAAYQGAKQIGFTILSLTVSLIAVFIPLLFMPGLVGRLFREFSVTLAVAVTMSALVSLTLTPMMCGHLLRPLSIRRSLLSVFIERQWLRLREWYRQKLVEVLRHQRLVLGLFGLTIVATVGLYMIVPKGLLPAQDTGQLTVVTKARNDISLQALQTLENQAVAIIRQNSAVANVTSFVGAGLTNPTPNTGRLSVTLRPIGTRPPIARVQGALQRALNVIPGLRSYIQPIPGITLSSRVSDTQYQYMLTDSDGPRLDRFANRLAERLQSNRFLRDVAVNAGETGLEAAIDVNRTRAAALGVTMQSLENVLYDAYGQREISTIYTQNNQYRVVLGVNRRFQVGPSDLADLFVPSTNQAQIPLYELAHIQTRRVPLALTRENQFPAVTMSFNLAPHVSIGTAERAIRRTANLLHKPASIVGTFTGAAAQFQKALHDEPWLIGATLIVVYLVLGILYESAIHPLTIISTLPSAGIGALCALLATGTQFTIVALVGIVLLMGIVKKNGIMMVDFAIEAQRQGLSPEAAIIEASVLRFRPIVMTTLAALFGAIPLVLEGGAGAELRLPLGITIIGGLLISQLLTLFTTPVIYLALDRASHGRARRTISSSPP